MTGHDLPLLDRRERVYSEERLQVGKVALQPTSGVVPPAPYRGGVRPLVEGEMEGAPVARGPFRDAMCLAELRPCRSWCGPPPSSRGPCPCRRRLRPNH